ncbi:MAG: hypothetical protein JO256_11925 [Alphaproteobacteria bacterium]|nr:hypothetical protein [Alphaproteobacteria bacterium]
MLRQTGRLVCILNCAANSSQAREIGDRVVQAFAKRGVTAKLRACDGHNLHDLAAQALVEGADTLIAAGGDGTVSAIAAAAVKAQAAMGVLPLGTLNHFAKDNGIPLELDAAVASILEGKHVPTDVAEVNGHIFVNNSSIGLYPHIVERREAQQERGAGKWRAFLQAAAFALYRFVKLNVHLKASEGRQIALRTPFVLIGNNKYEITGLKAGSRERLDRGLLWLHAAPDTGRARLAWLALKTLAGLHSRREWHSVETDTVEINFHGQKLKVSADGEVIELQGPLRYRTRPGALKLIVPDRAPAP